MSIKRILNKSRNNKTDCNSIFDALKPFYLPSETIDRLLLEAKRIGIPAEALVSSIIQEAF